jgi:hypothetical protein
MEAQKAQRGRTIPTWWFELARPINAPVDGTGHRDDARRIGEEEVAKLAQIHHARHIYTSLQFVRYVQASTCPSRPG